MNRFYKDVMVDEGANGYRILLDGRPIKTPAKHVLAAPTRALAEAIAAEWDAQGDTIDPVSMPFMRLADTVIDGILPAPGPVVDAILRFADNDLLCYRADNPPDLAARQAKGWDPLLDWARHRVGAALTVARGLNHVDQSPAALAALKTRVSALDGYALAGLHVFSSITGSLVLGLALLDGEITPAQAFALSRIDETYQAEKWGQDHEAQVRATALAREIDNAALFIVAAASAPDSL